MRDTFPLVDTHGLPLDTMVLVLHENKMMPDWLDFYHAAVKAGWKPEGVLSRLGEAVEDVYGSDFRMEWDRIIRQILAHG